MARLFDSGSSEYLTVAGAPVTVVPMTLSAWFNSAVDAVHRTLVALWDADATQYIDIILRGQVNKVWGECYDGAAGTSISTTTYTDNTWNHVAHVLRNSTDRSIFLNAGGEGTNITDVAPTGIDGFGVGVNRVGGVFQAYLNGSAAEVAIWNAALTDAEVGILAKGYSPLFVRPQNLVAYWPLIRDEDQDRVGGYDLTPVNTPSIAAHPPMIYPAPPSFFMAPVGAPSVGQPMMLRGTNVPGLRQWHPRV